MNTTDKVSAAHTPGLFNAYEMSRQRWAWEVRFMGGRTYARCDEEGTAKHIASALNDLNYQNDLAVALRALADMSAELLNCTSLAKRTAAEQYSYDRVQEAADAARAALAKVTP